MKTKPIPAIVMLVAGLVVCIAGMAGHMETGRFVKMLLVVLIVFYIIGGIVKLLIDKNFKDMEEETTMRKFFSRYRCSGRGRRERRARAGER